VTSSNRWLTGWTERLGFIRSARLPSGTSLDAEPPAPPELAVGHDAGKYDDTDPGSDDYRREELQEYLHDGAWVEGFGEWAATTDLDEDDWVIVVDLGFVTGFDWDFNETTRQLFGSNSGRSSGASYSVSQSM
jgi:hypothetical protein